MNSRSHTLSLFFVGTVGMILAVYLLMAASGRTQNEKDFDLETFGRLPIVDHGRVKPMDTLARISLMIISSRQEYVDEKGVTQPATRWLLDVMTAVYRNTPPDPQTIVGESRKVKAYRIEDPALRERLRLDGGSLFSYEEILTAAGPQRIMDLIEEFLTFQKGHEDLAERPQELFAALTDQERPAVELGFQIGTHLRHARVETAHRVFRIDNLEVLALLGLKERSGFRYGFDEFLPRVGDLEREASRAKEVKDTNQTPFDHNVLETARHVQIYTGLAQGTADSLHPVVMPNKKGDFITMRQAIQLGQKIDKDDAEGRSQALTSMAFLEILKGYSLDRPDYFNKMVSLYDKEVQKLLPKETARASTEASFNSFAPFYVCMMFYVVLFLVVSVSWIWPEPAINRFAFWATILTVCVHTWALSMRMYIQGRPPVTNLYSSAVFIGWACVLVTIVVEWIYRNGIPLAVGTITGSLTLLIAHHLGGSGDTLEMMQAVLDTNFWLATHVTSVTIGYSATFVAGVFGVITIVLVLTASIRRVDVPSAVMKLLGQCIYGVVCFALLFSFLGTVLGGIWADYSWGRFWGWDPKENGALLIVIMNATILHARWAGLIKVRGMAILSLVGTMVMFWSWFGTNQLGIGLHSYGINKTLVTLCSCTWVSLAGMIGLALLPLQAWNPKYTPVIRPTQPAPTPPTARRGKRGQIMPGGAT